MNMPTINNPVYPGGMVLRGEFPVAEVEQLEKELEEVKGLMGHVLTLHKAVSCEDKQPEVESMKDAQREDFKESLNKVLAHMTSRFLDITKKIGERKAEIERRKAQAPKQHTFPWGNPITAPSAPHIGAPLIMDTTDNTTTLEWSAPNWGVTGTTDDFTLHIDNSTAQMNYTVNSLDFNGVSISHPEKPKNS